MSLRVEGLVARPGEWAREDLAALDDQVADVGSLVAGREGTGVWLRAVVAACGPAPEARFATLVGDGGSFAIAVPLGPLLEAAVVAYALRGEPLPARLGGPMRLYLVDAPACAGSPGAALDACASVKRLERVRLGAEREPDLGHSPHAPGT